MYNPENKISIVDIANALGMRRKRVLEKVHKLDLDVNDGLLSVNGTLELVQTYVHSNKVSEETRQRAAGLNGQLKDGTFTKPIESKPKPYKTRRRNKKVNSARANIGKHCKQKGPGHFLVQTVNGTVQMGVNALESPQFKFVALLVAIAVQMQHSACWYGRTVSGADGNVYASYGYAFMVDLFILVVTMEGRISIAKTFAVLTFFSNILYFQFWVGFDGSVEAYTGAVSSILISGVIAYIVYAYSELFVKYRKVETKM